MAAHNVCQARGEEELKKLDAGAKESARLESMSISYQVDDLRRCLAKHVKLFQDI
jgi:fructose-bisphosphate aldolase class 1